MKNTNDNTRIPEDEIVREALTGSLGIANLKYALFYVTGGFQTKSTEIQKSIDDGTFNAFEIFEDQRPKTELDRFRIQTEVFERLRYILTGLSKNQIENIPFETWARINSFFLCYVEAKTRRACKATELPGDRRIIPLYRPSDNEDFPLEKYSYTVSKTFIELLAYHDPNLRSSSAMEKKLWFKKVAINAPRLNDTPDITRNITPDEALAKIDYEVG